MGHILIISTIIQYCTSRLRLSFDYIIFSADECGLSTRKVTEMTNFSCYGNDVTEMTGELSIVSLDLFTY